MALVVILMWKLDVEQHQSVLDTFKFAFALSLDWHSIELSVATSV